ncbi:Chloroperoxidase [Phyllosticta capitalensis]|uniref:Chloroperoxidase n=1 Tax=Phyllosticta capitalensis TaxID=121624 RepID=UPI00312E8402
MKFTNSLFLLSSLLPTASLVANAFPTLDPRALSQIHPDTFTEALELVKKHRNTKRASLLANLTSPVETTGDHAFQAPDFDAGDQRGPCPGLNVLANHGYIARDGVTSFLEVVTTINEVLGMGIELATVLGVMGTVWTGNPLSLNPGFSIGGPNSETDNLLDNLGGLLGTPRGLQGSHNWIESDASLTRNDLYMTGDSWTMNMTLFEEFYNMADEDGVLSMDTLAQQAANRFEYAVAHNPNFYYGPITGMIARNAGYFFLGRLLANHTEEHPEGILTQDIFKKFFAVVDKEDGTMEYKKGHETFPDNWYRKPIEYGLVPLNLDIVGWVLKHPVLGSVGGNTGTVNSFSGLELSNITGGVLNSASLLESNNLLCFVFEVLKTFMPNSLSPLMSTLEKPIEMVTDALSAPLLSLACPAFKDMEVGGQSLWDAIQDKYPGAKTAGSSL